MKYLIQFTPLCPYFFGGEQTFGEDGKDRTNYFAKSNFMPQLSTILGTLRYRILNDNEFLDKDVSLERLRELIGEQGFCFPENLDDLSEMKDYGCIKRISPVFIADEIGRYYTRMPLNRTISDEKIEAPIYYSGIRKNSYYTFPNYDCKNFNNYKLWVNPDGDKCTSISEDTIFTIQQQIGIIKDKASNKTEDAFVKQNLIRLQPGLSFCCTAELDDNSGIQEGNTIVFMGANRSAFNMCVSVFPDNIKDLDFISSGESNYFFKLNESSSSYKILLSDAFITEKLKNNADFIWGESINFKCIVNRISNGHSWAKPNKSSLYHLLPAGSVIYGNSELITEELAQPMLQQIGYNIFI